MSNLQRYTFKMAESKEGLKTYVPIPLETGAWVTFQAASGEIDRLKEQFAELEAKDKKLEKIVRERDELKKLIKNIEIDLQIRASDDGVVNISHCLLLDIKKVNEE